MGTVLQGEKNLKEKRTSAAVENCLTAFRSLSGLLAIFLQINNDAMIGQEQIRQDYARLLAQLAKESSENGSSGEAQD